MSRSPAPVHPRDAQASRGWPWAELAFPVALLALGVLTVVQAAGINDPVSSNTVGPRAFPYAVGLLTVASALALLVGILRGQRGEAEVGEDVDAGAGTDWLTVAKLTGSFAALVVLVEPLGWPVAATVLFAGAAWSLGARPWWRVALLGAVLALLTQVLFTQVLGVYLPAGPLEGVPFLG